jgi:hypothetical protein
MRLLPLGSCSSAAPAAGQQKEQILNLAFPEANKLNQKLYDP